MKKIKIVLDTNNMNAYGKNPDLNFIENCENEGLVEIYYGGDTLHDLKVDGSRNQIRLNKFRSKERVVSTGRIGYSSIPFILGRDPPLDDAIALLIFGKKWAEIVEKKPGKMNSKIDVKLIEASVINKIEYFITQDSQLLVKADGIKEKYGILIVNREMMKQILIDQKQMQYEKNKERVFSLFHELRDLKKIIDKKIQLVPNNHIPTFQGLNIFNVYKIIRFNQQFYENKLSKFDDNIIRFILLHEVGHISADEPLLSRIENVFVTTIITITVLATLFIFVIPNWIFLISFISLSVILLIGIFVHSRPDLKEAEFFADDYALIMIKKNFPVNDICILIDDCFTLLNIVNKNNTGYWLESDYHPTNAERIDRMRKNEHCGSN